MTPPDAVRPTPETRHHGYRVGPFFADYIGESLTVGIHVGRFGLALSFDWGWRGRRAA